MNINTVADTLNQYFKSKTLTSLMLRYSVPMLIVSSAIMIFPFWRIILRISYLVFLFSIVLCFSQKKYDALSLGFGVCCIDEIKIIVEQLLRFNGVGLIPIFNLIFYGVIIYINYNKSKEIIKNGIVD